MREIVSICLRAFTPSSCISRPDRSRVALTLVKIKIQYKSFSWISLLILSANRRCMESKFRGGVCGNFALFRCSCIVLTRAAYLLYCCFFAVFCWRIVVTLQHFCINTQNPDIKRCQTTSLVTQMNFNLKRDSSY